MTWALGFVCVCLLYAVVECELEKSRIIMFYVTNPEKEAITISPPQHFSSDFSIQNCAPFLSQSSFLQMTLKHHIPTNPIALVKRLWFYLDTMISTG